MFNKYFPHFTSPAFLFSLEKCVKLVAALSANERTNYVGNNALDSIHKKEASEWKKFKTSFSEKKYLFISTSDMFKSIFCHFSRTFFTSFFLPPSPNSLSIASNNNVERKAISRSQLFACFKRGSWWRGVHQKPPFYRQIMRQIFINFYWVYGRMRERRVKIFVDCA